jgi:hypothetical protein
MEILPLDFEKFEAKVRSLKPIPVYHESYHKVVDGNDEFKSELYRSADGNITLRHVKSRNGESNWIPMLRTGQGLRGFVDKESVKRCVHGKTIDEALNKLKDQYGVGIEISTDKMWIRSGRPGEHSKRGKKRTLQPRHPEVVVYDMTKYHSVAGYDETRDVLVVGNSSWGRLFYDSAKDKIEEMCRLLEHEQLHQTIQPLLGEEASHIVDKFSHLGTSDGLPLSVIQAI